MCYRCEGRGTYTLNVPKGHPEYGKERPCPCKGATATVCPKCRDLGYVHYDVPMGHPLFGVASPCDCRSAAREQAKQRKLEALDGLTERERSHRFDNTTATPKQREAFLELMFAQAGIIVLQGAPGAGKSYLMHCTVNQARGNKRSAVYTTMTDVLDYLRSAFDPKSEQGFDARWKLLCECSVLCIDELDEFNATEWARERFLRLIDERWRNRDRLLTVVALNGDARKLIPKVASRLTQGRVLELKSADLRQTFRDQLVPA